MKLSNFSLAVALVALVFVSSSSAVTIGDLTPSTKPTGYVVDGYVGGVYADTSQTFGANGIAGSVTFNGPTTSAGNELTFLVGTVSGTQFTPTGIFNDIIVSGGLETVNLTTLGIASGSANVAAGETFGWTDQTIGVGYNSGSIYYGTGNYDYFTADETQKESVAVGTAVGNLGYGGRDYNVNMTVVPEPASVILAGLGAAGVFIAAGRRRKS